MNPKDPSLGRPHCDALHQFYPIAMISRDGWFTRVFPESDVLHQQHPGAVQYKQV